MSETKNIISVLKTVQGAWIVTELKDGKKVSITYYGMSKEQALREFESDKRKVKQ